jgi:PA14 domain
MVLFNASFGESIVSWGGGTATGPRQIVAAVPFMVVALAFVPAGWNWLLTLLAAPSLLAMLMATSIEPHFPYEYDNPLRDFVWQAYLRGDFAYDRDAFFGGEAIVDESTAFNLGKLAGLRGSLQLWPLAALWMAGVWRLLGRSLDAGWKGVWRCGAVGVLGVLFLLPLAGIFHERLKPIPTNGLRGRYYRELHPNGFPPHVDRVDPQLDLGNVAAMGAMPAPSRVVWSGTLTAPVQGSYLFLVQADDSGWLTIDGRPVIPDPGPVEKESAVGTCFLSKGPHQIIAGERNLGGDASMRLSWVPPNGSMAIVPSTALTPN